ncbi:MAG TPA: ferritin-like domain-containing protein [Nitriliruptorales bacterium]
MSTHRYAVPVDVTGWHIPGVESDVAFTWDYDNGRKRMLNLYEKGKEKQWNTTVRIDWSHDIDPADQAAAPDEIIPIFGSPTWEKLSREEKDRTRHHYLAWVNSQFLHGEQGALVCAAKIVETVPDIDSKFYAATQVMDEARHVETYGRFINEKIDLCYPINGSLAQLLEQTITDSRWDYTYLGMQVLIEGVALAAFSMIRDFTGDPLAKSINAYVMQDEARHIAFGRLALKDAYADLTEAERAEREEFVVEGSYLLRDRFLAREVWENLGYDADELTAWVDKHQMMTEFRKALFSRVVPTVKDIGLWGDKVQAAYEDMGVLGFQDNDLDMLSQADEDIAEELEKMLAAQAAGDEASDNGSRGAALAQTMAHATD